MIAFTVVVLDVFGNRSAEMTLAERDHAMQTLVLDRAHEPYANPHAERWVRAVKDECLSKLILFGESALRAALRAYIEHFHAERNHQGKSNLLLFPRDEVRTAGPVRCRERLGGLLKFYHRAAA